MEGKKREGMLGLAVVFDGAGVIYAPFRIIKDMERGVTKRSRVSGITCTDRLGSGAMVVLKTRYEETMEKEDPSNFLSDLMKEKKIESKVIYKREGVSDEEVLGAILGDKSVNLGDVHEAVSLLRCCDILPVLGIGLIVDMVKGTIRYVIAGGINLFPGTLKLFKELREWGVRTFIASGDRIESEEMAMYLPDVPPENIFGTMKPEDKRELVGKLKDEYKVMMVGDDRNDYLAMREADIAVLSLQEAADRPKEVFDVADLRIRDIVEIRGIIKEMQG
ncbi:MAG TPA: HAD family hydrolase [Candidatus Bathyarchaeia archaeon]|nr:HAD family hydrolase [Candidatus Bathyarchaeia archaeon]